VFFCVLLSPLKDLLSLLEARELLLQLLLVLPLRVVLLVLPALLPLLLLVECAPPLVRNASLLLDPIPLLYVTVSLLLLPALLIWDLIVDLLYTEVGLNAQLWDFHVVEPNLLTFLLLTATLLPLGVTPPLATVKQ